MTVALDSVIAAWPLLVAGGLAYLLGNAMRGRRRGGDASGISFGGEWGSGRRAADGCDGGGDGGGGD